MTPYDYWIRKIPDYDRFMALDGWTPQDILTALRYQMTEESEETADETQFG